MFFLGFAGLFLLLFLGVFGVFVLFFVGFLFVSRKNPWHSMVASDFPYVCLCCLFFFFFFFGWFCMMCRDSLYVS